MSNLFNSFLLSILTVTLLNFAVFPSHPAIAETIIDPMRPPAFALNKFRLAKLKKSGTSRSKSTAAKKSVIKPLKLSAILIGSNRKIAIINDQMLVVGDRIDRSRVNRIFKDRVEISRSGRKLVLRLDKDLSAIRKNTVKSKL